MNRTEIIERIERAISSKNLKTLIPVLTQPTVIVDFSSKQVFYDLLNEFIDIEKISSSGKWYSRRKDFDSDSIFLDFYDTIHFHPRLSIQIGKNGILTKLDLFPF